MELWLQVVISVAGLVIALVAQGIIIAGIVAKSIGKVREELRSETVALYALIEERRRERVVEAQRLGDALEAHRNQDREEFRLLNTQLTAAINAARDEARVGRHDLFNKLQAIAEDADKRLDAFIGGAIRRDEFQMHMTNFQSTILAQISAVTRQPAPVAP